MSDLDVIRKIEKKLGKQLVEISISNYTNSEYLDSELVYAIDENYKVIALSLTFEKTSLEEEILKLNELQYLRLGLTYWPDYSSLSTLTCLTKLDIYYNNLSSASFISPLVGLTGLNLFGNDLTDISFISTLSELKYLSLGENEKLVDYSSLSYLSNLIVLDLRSCCLSNISFLSVLSSLKSLNLSQNGEITDYSILATFSKLTRLSLVDNNLSNISFLLPLLYMRTLDLSGNKYITDYSPLSSLPNLTILSLRRNNLSDVSFITSLSSLKSIDLRGNNISDISFLMEMKKLENVDLDENPNIIEPPKEIIEQGIEAIRNYFKEKEKGEDYLYEAKVMFVGEPWAGKTSLMEKLLDPSFPVPNPNKGKGKKESTLGIDIKTWKFDLYKEITQKFNVNFWDFGGQNIQYYIHQFFLTEDSVYVLVVDDRQDQQNTHYWFKIITLLAKNCPVLLVRNENDIDSSTMFDEDEYIRKYGDDLDIHFLDVDLSQDDGRLEKISAKIKELIQELNIIGTSLPSTWLDVVEKITQKKEKGKEYISIENFQEVCEECGIEEYEKQKFLCEYLRLIGKIVFFKNDAKLENVVYLNPMWITKAVYSILGNKKLEKQQGLFTREWISEQWGDLYSDTEKDRILLMMQKEDFDLCYQTKKNSVDYYLAPRHLSSKKPEDAKSENWKNVENLSFRFVYEFMPNGIIARVIVRLNDYVKTYIENKLLAWRNGVILNNSRCEALIKEVSSGNQKDFIEIIVTGPDAISRKRLFDKIKYTIDSIHEQSFKNIVYSPFIPCYCADCKKGDQKYFEDQELLNAIKKGKKTIECRNSYEDIEIEKLLGFVIDAGSIKSDSIRKAGMDENDGNDRHRLSLTDKKLDLIIQSLHSIRPDISINIPERDVTNPESDKPPEPPKQQKRYWNVMIILGVLGLLVTIYSLNILGIRDKLENRQNECIEITQEEPQSPSHELEQQSNEEIPKTESDSSEVADSLRRTDVSESPVEE